ncbi:chromosome partitioning protein ParB [Bifidobacterium sp. DSM 109960]|uniref:Chromosome partitioning protein ParB n=1 Tax=Bifidobacterium erythrocebi TaxID=2675325 RepID=A0A7Y0HW76_9BIFI|nr:ParB/RepB/Spo0J family partition protein [Bifidobacterium sp. DSM 109960]NMM97007.1 chromosome partitioning protein ParB [Bifidobacterium sp. DSM 109960]
MASKSRLGKGLGALFPALPGEGSHEQHVVSRETARDDMKQSLAAERERKVVLGEPRSAAAQNAKPTEPKTTTQSTKPTSVVEEDAPVHIPSIQHAVSPHSSTSKGRVTMPGIEDIAHPSDMFFDDTVSLQPKRRGKADATKTDAPSDTKQQDEQSNQAKLKPVEGGYLAELNLDEIGPNAHQPRSIFDENELNELAASIKEVGILQPIVVRKRPAEQIAEARKAQAGTKPANRFDGRMDSPYELIMGERRWRASQLAGLDTIPAIVKTTADNDMLRDALLENLHRVALNPLEEAAAYQQMVDEFGLTQAQLSKSVSKSRPQIANTLRLLNLPASVQKKVAAGILSAGHARALLGLSEAEEMDKLANRIIAEGLSVRSTEEIVAMANLNSTKPKKPRARRGDPWANSPIKSNLEHRFETKVSIKGTPKHGHIEIVFSSPEDMDRILGLLMPDQKGDQQNEQKNEEQGKEQGKA